MQKYELFVGIDMSKQWLDVRPTRNGEVKQMPHRRFDNNLQGFAKMDRWLEAYSRQQGIGDHWLFCMEHTGVYTLPLCHHLQEQGRDVVLESPLHLVQSLGIRRGKNDKADAGDIARYAYQHREELWPRPMCSGTLLRIQALLSYRCRLERYGNGLTVASKEWEAFAPTDARGPLRAHSQEVEKHLGEKVREVEKLIRQEIKKDEGLSEKFRLLTSVKGVGLIIGSYMLLYTNGFTAFDNARKFACYAGLAPFGKQSGTTMNVPAKVSQLANKRIKALLSCGAMSAIRHDPDIRAYYQRRLQEGYDKNKLLNAVKNKLVHRMFAVVKRGTPYVGIYKG